MSAKPFLFAFALIAAGTLSACAAQEPQIASQLPSSDEQSYVIDFGGEIGRVPLALGNVEDMMPKRPFAAPHRFHHQMGMMPGMMPAMFPGEMPGMAMQPGAMDCQDPMTCPCPCCLPAGMTPPVIDLPAKAG